MKGGGYNHSVTWTVDTMSLKRLLLFAIVLSALPAWCGHTLTKQQQRIVDSWLAQHATYRAARDADCNCPDDIRQMKSGYGPDWPGVPDYHPFVATGDFNGDGVADFAIAVVDNSKSEKNFTLLVFNAPFGSNQASPAYTESDLDLRYQGLSFGPPRPKPYRLVIGPFESDNTWILVPRGRTYKVQVNEGD
jgi:hypothetical protein